MQQNLNEGAEPLVARVDKEAMLGHKGMAIWMTGLSGSGKTTLAYALEEALHQQDILTKVLDGDNLRRGLNAGLGFSAEDRAENIRRTAELARQLVSCGVVVICSLITPTNELRQLAENILGPEDFLLYHISTPLTVCEQRDVKGHYKRARAGEIPDFTGISAPFDEPVKALFSLDTSNISIDDSVQYILSDIHPLITL